MRCQCAKSRGWRRRTASSQAHARMVLPRRRLNFCMAHRTKCWSIRHAMRCNRER
jgi:hypothetical protein